MIRQRSALTFWQVLVMTASLAGWWGMPGRRRSGLVVAGSAWLVEQAGKRGDGFEQQRVDTHAAPEVTGRHSCSSSCSSPSYRRVHAELPMMLVQVEPIWMAAIRAANAVEVSVTAASRRPRQLARSSCH